MDVFDQVTAAPDVFDQVAPEKKDVFDSVAGDVFDQVAPARPHNHFEPHREATARDMSTDGVDLMDASRYNVSPQEMQDAFDYVGALVTPGESTGSPSQPPGVTAKVAAGLQQAGVGLAAGISDPRFIALGAAAPKALAAGFALKAASELPEQGKELGEALAEGDPFRVTKAVASPAMGALMITGGAHAGREAIKEFKDSRGKAIITGNEANENAVIAPGEVSEFGGAEEPVKDVFDQVQPNAGAATTTNTAGESDVAPPSPAPKTEVESPESSVESQAPPSTLDARPSTPVMLQPAKFPVVEVPLKDLSLSKDVPNFKENADEETGVVEGQKLAGDYERLGTGAITVFERLDGSKEVISGRHRFDLAKRSGEETIPSQIVREADGFTPQMAMVLDAEMNIRDGQGSVGDYANFFRNAGVTPEQAAQRGLLARAKGKAGWAIGRGLSDDAYASYRAGKISEGQAQAIAEAAPVQSLESNVLSAEESATQDSRLKTQDSLQRVGIKAALDGRSPQEIKNFVQAVRLETRNLPQEQFDLFAADDSALKQAEQMAKIASRIQNELSREIKATDAAAKNAVTARAKGIAFEKPPEEILADNAQLKADRDRWDNWALHKELVDQVRGYTEMKRSAETLEQKLDKFKIDTRGQLHAFGLLPEAWNTLIDLVKLGVKGGRKLAEAVDWAIEKFKEQNPGATFDETRARDHLLRNEPTRQRAEKILADENVSEPVKAEVEKDLSYEPRSFEQVQQEADAIISRLGHDNAAELFKNSGSRMPLDTRQALGAKLQDHFATQEKIARASGNKVQADQMAGKQVELWKADAYGTELAQGLNARRLYDKMSPAGMLHQAKDLFGAQSEKQWQDVKPAADTVKESLRTATEQAVEDVRQDKAVNEAARKAVDEQIVADGNVHRAVVMELAEPFAQSPTILAHAREQVRAKANELLNHAPRPPQFTPSQHLRVILDDLSKRAASIASGHYQGSEPGATLSQKLQQRLGIGKPHADKLAVQLDKEFAKMVEAAKKRIPTRIAEARARQEQPYNPMDIRAKAVDAEIYRQLREHKINLGKALRAGMSTATKETLAERVVKASGLTGEAADVLRQTFQHRFEQLAGARKRAALDALQKSPGAVPRQISRAFDKLIRLSNLGAFDDAQFYDLIKKQLDLPVMTDELAKEIVRRANDLQKIPEGYLRDRAAGELMNYVTQQKGLRWVDYPMGIFYSNILSGITTPAKIVFENTNMLIGNTLTAMLTRPKDLFFDPARFITDLAKAQGRGLKKGALQAEGTLRTGIVTGVWSDARSNVMEMKPFGRFEPLNVWKYFGRVIGTSHETTFKPAWEVKQTLLARDTARREGLSGQALQQRVANLLANTDAHVTAAKAQATREFAALGNFKKADFHRRVGEILEQQREANMPGATAIARDFALRSSYLNEPYGFMGLVADGIRSTLANAREKYPILGTAAKTQVPFTTVVANILNEKLNWTPVGAARAAASLKSGELYGRKIMEPNERAELIAKSIIGTVALTTAATIFAQHIHGNGPGSPEHRKQLQAAGWIPHSIEYHGKYYSYMNTPAALGLAVVGNYLDWQRYGKGENADGVSRAAFATKATANAIVSQGMLDSLKRFFEALGSESTSEGASKLEKLAARTASSFVVPNLIQQIDRHFDPTVYDQTGTSALLKSQIPFVRRDNKPALNVLGEPVQSGPFQYWASEQSKDPVWRLIADKQLFIVEPRRDQIIGRKTPGAVEGVDYRALTPDEFYNYVKTSGQAIRAQLSARLDELQQMEPARARYLVQHLVEFERARAKAQFEK